MHSAEIERLQEILDHDARQGNPRRPLHDLLGRACAALPRREPLLVPKRAHSDFTAVFVDGQEFIDEEGERSQVRVVDAGELVLPMGRVALCDPTYASSQGGALAVAVPPGRYPVSLSLGDVGPFAAMVRFSDRPAVRWELARWPGQSTAELGPGQVFGFGVDAATACFVDASLADRIEAAVIIVESAPRCVTLDAETGGNVVAYETCSDGVYASYWGLDDAGRPSRLITEIESLVEEESAGCVISGVFSRPPGEVRHALLDAVGLRFEVARTVRPDDCLVLALFGPTANRASIKLLESDGRSEADRRRTGGGSGASAGIEYEYQVFELDGEAARDLAVEVSVWLGDRPRSPVAPRPERGDGSVYGFLDP